MNKPTTANESGAQEAVVSAAELLDRAAPAVDDAEAGTSLMAQFQDVLAEFGQIAKLELEFDEDGTVAQRFIQTVDEEVNEFLKYDLRRQ